MATPNDRNIGLKGLASSLNFIPMKSPENLRFSNNVTLSWWRSLSYRNQSIDFQSKSLNCFLYSRALRHEKLKGDKEVK